MMPFAEFWAFLSLVAVAYWTLPHWMRPSYLAAVSLIYLTILNGVHAAAFLLILVGAYGSARCIRVAAAAGSAGDRTSLPIREAGVGGNPRLRRLWVPFWISVVLAYILCFKYLPPLRTDTADWFVPWGISYFTLKLIHYLVESQRGALPAHGLADLTSYALLFPTLTAGPIERFDHFLSQRQDVWRAQHLIDGSTRIVLGIVKRFALIEVVLPAILGPVASTPRFVSGLGEASTLSVWQFVIVRHLYGYLDFSAYADLAIGSSRLFGLRIMENFNAPFLAPNIVDFWRRWHMTLASWCQGYVFLPLVGLTRSPYLAVFGAFVVTGLWHAGSLQWLAWGLYHASGIVVFLAWQRFKVRSGWKQREPKWAAWLGYPLTILFVSAGQVFPATDRQGTFGDSLRMLAKLVGVH